MVKEAKSRKYKHVSSGDKAWINYAALVNVLLPEIVYFPTFLFELPSKIILNPLGKEAPSDKLYRTIIENVGQSLESKIDVKKALVERIVTPETAGEVFLGLFSLSNNRQQQIESAINQMSHHLSTTVLDSWSRIFDSAPGDREIRLKIGVDKHPDDSPRVYVQFTVRDGTQTYDISERSTGFRWFFSFLLFTLYRARSSSSKKTLFLLDEPASNLHAGAQSQLLESFPKIASRGNQIIYSTHSHYLINPSWLDQAFIISNAAMTYNDLTEGPKWAARHTLISVERYRQFVGSHPDKTTYFQPVLDRLQVTPSRLDSLVPSILVEGKGDYLILSYGLFLLDKIGDYAIIPTRGADHLSELIGILLGWGVNFALCCDDDKPGKKAVDEFINEWGLSSSRAFTLAAVSSSLEGKTIEGFLAQADLDLIKLHFNTAKAPTKSQIRLFFSEQLARKSRAELSKDFLERINSFDETARQALGILGSGSLRPQKTKRQVSE